MWEHVRVGEDVHVWEDVCEVVDSRCSSTPCRLCFCGRTSVCGSMFVCVLVWLVVLLLAIIVPVRIAVCAFVGRAFCFMKHCSYACPHMVDVRSVCSLNCWKVISLFSCR